MNVKIFLHGKDILTIAILDVIIEFCNRSRESIILDSKMYVYKDCENKIIIFSDHIYLHLNVYIWNNNV